MNKSLVPRFLILLAAAAAVFILLIQMQFGKTTSFTRRMGDLVVRGRYGTLPQGVRSLPDVYPLEGELSVFFGGLEFILGDGSFRLSGPGGAVKPGLLTMSVSDNGIYLRLAEGPELAFITQYTGGAIELLIRADFSGGEEALRPERAYLEFPYRPLPTSKIRERGSSFLLSAGGLNYTFSRNTGAGNLIRLETANPAISYRVLPEREMSNPLDFIIPAALDTAEYEAALALWLDQSYLGWNRAVAQNSQGESAVLTGEMISAYMSEALKRGNYKAAAAAVSTAAITVSSYEASPYVNRLDMALRTLAASERERSARYARLFNEKSPDFLKEYRIIEFLGVRGYNNLMNDAVEMLRGFDPALMTVEHAAGFLEGRSDWERFRSGRNNPYDRFVDQAVFVITEGMYRDPQTGYVLVFLGDEADSELNLRLGSALLQYGDDTRIALGRTLILSVLSLADSSGAVPVSVVRSGNGQFSGKPGTFLPSPRIYRTACAGEYYARAQSLEAGTWAWTAASSVGAASSPGNLELTVNFPPGETHYMLIRGIRPFTRFRLNGTNVSPDPQFERYDASGWTYSAAEQTLLVKLRHRLPVERISLAYDMNNPP
ncbi:MAG: hypothetical protein LBD31_11555 [Treponema sp.]|nr:hypothetical protein [Treponema sp.]